MLDRGTAGAGETQITGVPQVHPSSGMEVAPLGATSFSMVERMEFAR